MRNFTRIFSVMVGSVLTVVLAIATALMFKWAFSGTSSKEESEGVELTIPGLHFLYESAFWPMIRVFIWIALAILLLSICARFVSLVLDEPDDERFYMTDAMRERYRREQENYRWKADLLKKIQDKDNGV